MFERFTVEVREVLVDAQQRAQQRKASEITPMHLLAASVAPQMSVAAVFARHRLDQDSIERTLDCQPLGVEDAAALRHLGIDLDAIRSAVEEQFGPGALNRPGGRHQSSVRGTLRFAGCSSLRFAGTAKKSLELALREALRLGHRDIHVEHLVLGTLRCGDAQIGELVRQRGVDPAALRADLDASAERSAR